jgi:hypothetical protein
MPDIHEEKNVFNHTVSLDARLIHRSSRVLANSLVQFTTSVALD